MTTKKKIALQIEKTRAHGRSLLEGIAEYALSHPEWSFDLLEADMMHRPDIIKKYDGFIVRIMDDETAKMLSASRKPVIDTYGRLKSSAIPSIRIDDEALAIMAAKYFADHRFTRVAYCGFSGLRFSDARGTAFAAAARAHGMKCSIYTEKPQISDTFFRNERADCIPDAEGLMSWVKHLEKPVGVFCCNDLRAHQLLKVCASHSLDIPHDIAILGADNDTLLCTFTNPPLSSIDTNPAEIGRQAAEMLAKQLAGKELRSETVLVPPKRIVPRQSSEIYPLGSAWLSDALVHIDRHLAVGITANEVIAFLGYSHTTVNNAFRAELGRSIHQEIIRLRLERACHLLKETQLPAAAIAKECGYPNAQYFSRAFSTAFGLPPDGWRKKENIHHTAS